MRCDVPECEDDAVNRVTVVAVTGEGNPDRFDLCTAHTEEIKRFDCDTTVVRVASLRVGCA